VSRRSGTPAAAARIDLDRYWTPLGYSRPLLARMPIGGRVLEPSAGVCRLADPIAALPSVSEVVTADIVAGPGIRLVADMTQPEPWQELGVFDWIVMNPPFFAVERFVELALPRARMGVIWLARISFVEPTTEKGFSGEGRERLLLEAPPERALILPRTKLRKDRKGTDSATCAWFMRGPAVRPGIEIVSKKEFRRWEGAAAA
jgi:hypothetical protein